MTFFHFLESRNHEVIKLSASDKLQGRGVIRYREGVPIRYRERASIRYRVLRIFRKRGGYKVQPNFSAFFPVFFLSKERSLSYLSKPLRFMKINRKKLLKNCIFSFRRIGALHHGR